MFHFHSSAVFAAISLGLFFLLSLSIDINNEYDFFPLFFSSFQAARFASYVEVASFVGFLARDVRLSVCVYVYECCMSVFNILTQWHQPGLLK